jgi:hypothetical protein
LSSTHVLFNLPAFHGFRVIPHIITGQSAKTVDSVTGQVGHDQIEGSEGMMVLCSSAAASFVDIYLFSSFFSFFFLFFSFHHPSQMPWDLASYTILLVALEWAFDLPMVRTSVRGGNESRRRDGSSLYF